MKFKDGAKEITLQDCIRIHEKIGLNFIVEDGKDVTFEIEKEPFAEGPKEIYKSNHIL